MRLSLPKSHNPKTHNKPSVVIQPKLRVNKPGDRYEQEADRVANLVMRMPASFALERPAEESPSEYAIQRMPSQVSPSLEDREILNEENEGMVQTLREDQGGDATQGLSRQHIERASSGKQMETGVRRFMETRFGSDFSKVRIHSDRDAAELTTSIQARAFTFGSHIYFDRQEYRPNTHAGRSVLAHELTHVVQQGASAAQLPISSLANPGVGSVQRLGPPGRVLNENVYPWGNPGPVGQDREIQTDAGSTVVGWVAYSPNAVNNQYWCHGHSTGSYVSHDYSIYSRGPFKKVIQDEYDPVPPDQTQADDLAVWTDQFDHSAIFLNPNIVGGLPDSSSTLSSKNGNTPLNTYTLGSLAGEYGSSGIGVFRKK